MSIDTKALRELLAKATPGPVEYAADSGAIIGEPNEWLCQFWGKSEEDYPNRDNNGAFVAWLWNNAHAFLSAADRLAALEAENSRLQACIQLYKADFEYGLNGLKHEYAKLKQDNARLRGQISAMLGELEDFAMQNDLPIEDGHGYFGTGLPLSALQEWLLKQKDALAAGGDQ